MKRAIFIAALALAACATPGPIREVETVEVAVTRTERAITETQVREVAPPAPVGARPAGLSSALDLVVAKLCEWVGWGERVDPLLQHSAGMPIERRVHEPICQLRE